jgi:N utilization substance protein B
VQLDERIRAASQNWRLERMARIDRNALRLGAFELLTRSDVPRAVILDEAVELAKRFGSDESSKFVNGVLDRIADDLGRSDADRG